MPRPKPMTNILEKQLCLRILSYYSVKLLRSLSRPEVGSSEDGVLYGVAVLVWRLFFGNAFDGVF